MKTLTKFTTDGMMSDEVVSHEFIQDTIVRVLGASCKGMVDLVSSCYAHHRTVLYSAYEVGYGATAE